MIKTAEIIEKPPQGLYMKAYGKIVLHPRKDPGRQMLTVDVYKKGLHVPDSKEECGQEDPPPAGMEGRPFLKKADTEIDQGREKDRMGEKMGGQSLPAAVPLRRRRRSRQTEEQKKEK